MRIGLDIDDVLAEFMGTYLARFGKPKFDFEITRNVTQILSKDKDFWVTLPVLNRLNFEPTLYCTKRINKKSWTKQWLQKNNFPNKPVYQMVYQYGNKADLIKGKCDVLIDDSISNVTKAIKSGLPALIFDRPHNQNGDSTFRIYSLDIEEIKQAYKLELKMLKWI